MSNAITDQNYVPAKLAVLNTDTVQGQHLVRVAINPVNGGLKVNTTDAISFTMVPIDARDENYRECMMFVGSDGRTYPCVANSSGELLISL